MLCPLIPHASFFPTIGNFCSTHWKSSIQIAQAQSGIDHRDAPAQVSQAVVGFIFGQFDSAMGTDGERYGSQGHSHGI